MSKQRSHGQASQPKQKASPSQELERKGLQTERKSRMTTIDEEIKQIEMKKRKKSVHFPKDIESPIDSDNSDEESGPRIILGELPEFNTLREPKADPGEDQKAKWRIEREAFKKAMQISK